MSGDTCHMSGVTCQVSDFSCQVSFFFFFFFSSFFFRKKWWSWSVEGLVSTGPTPSSLDTNPNLLSEKGCTFWLVVFLSEFLVIQESFFTVWSWTGTRIFFFNSVKDVYVFLLYIKETTYSLIYYREMFRALYLWVIPLVFKLFMFPEQYFWYTCFISILHSLQKKLYSELIN